MKHNTANVPNLYSVNMPLKLGLSLCVISALLLSSAPAHSAEIDAKKGLLAYSQAVNTSQQEPDKQALLETLHQHVKQLVCTNVANKVVTRDQMMAIHQKEALTAVSQKQRALVQQNQVSYYDFTIYDASIRLFEDYDYDGFYQTFSVTFDADIISYNSAEHADVFAELYLSQDGGPWVHYYSTDVFTLHADSSDDDYEVLTTLASGYQTDHYDVLIDLYELGYADPVATISADESNALYALPLESSDRDEVYVEDVYIEEVYAGGALSWWSLGFVGCFVWLRRFVNYHN